MPVDYNDASMFGTSGEAYISLMVPAAIAVGYLAMPSTLFSAGDDRSQKAAKLNSLIQVWSLSEQEITFLFAAGHRLLQPRRFKLWLQKTQKLTEVDLSNLMDFVEQVLVSRPSEEGEDTYSSPTICTALPHLCMSCFAKMSSIFDIFAVVLKMPFEMVNAWCTWSWPISGAASASTWEKNARHADYAVDALYGQQDGPVIGGNLGNVCGWGSEYGWAARSFPESF